MFAAYIPAEMEEQKAHQNPHTSAAAPCSNGRTKGEHLKQRPKDIRQQFQEH